MWTVDSEVVRKLREKLADCWIGTDLFEPPDEQVLRELLKVALAASLTRDEGRPTTFALAYLSAGGAQTPLTYQFERARDFTVEVMRRLAPTLDGPFSFLVVTEETGKLRVVGGLRCVQSFDVTRRELPVGLLIAVRGPGELSVSICGDEVLRTAAGANSWLPRSHQVEADLYEKIDLALGPRPGRDLGPSREAPVLLKLARRVLAHGHGGTILVLAPDCSQQLLKYGFRTVGSALTERVKSAQRAPKAAPHDPSQCEGLSLPARELDETILAVSQLTAVDGAVVLGADLTLYGFGVKIGGEDAEAADRPRRVWNFSEEGTLVSGASTARGGTRHQSAERFVAQTSGKALAFVASQDGQLSMYWRAEDAVHVIRPIGPAAHSKI